MTRSGAWTRRIYLAAAVFAWNGCGPKPAPATRSRPWIPPAPVESPVVACDSAHRVSLALPAPPDAETPDEKSCLGGSPPRCLAAAEERQKLGEHATAVAFLIAGCNQ